MSDNIELEQRVEELERQLEVLRKAKPIQSLPGNTIAFKAFLKELLATKVPEERNAFLKLVSTRAHADGEEVMPIRSLTDLESPARQQMIVAIDDFLDDLAG